MKIMITTIFCFMMFIVVLQSNAQSQMHDLNGAAGTVIPIIQNISSTSVNMLIYIEITNKGKVRFKGTTEKEVTIAEGKRYYVISVPGSAYVYFEVLSNVEGKFEVVQVIR